MRATRTKGTQQTAGSLARRALGKPKPTRVRLLTPDEEFELVAKLGKLRGKLERLLAPFLEGAPDDVRLNHFDQKLAYAHEQAMEIGKSFGVETASLLLRYKEIKEELVMANLPWVTKLARAQRQPTITEEDLFQEGVCGLLKAIDRFEPERGLRLMTYATWYIREAMQQIRARQSHLVSISSHDQTLLGQAEAQMSAFQHQHNRLPNSNELVASLRGNPRQISRLQMATKPAVSLERGGMEGAIPIPVDDPIPEFDRKEEVLSAVARLLDALPWRERWIVTRRFGLDGHEPTSLEVLGDDLNVSKERVRQLQRQAIKRMLQAAEEDELEPAAI